jgi:signal transduction histidine kinase
MNDLNLRLFSSPPPLYQPLAAVEAASNPPTQAPTPKQPDQQNITSSSLPDWLLVLLMKRVIPLLDRLDRAVNRIAPTQRPRKPSQSRRRRVRSEREGGGRSGNGCGLHCRSGIATCFRQPGQQKRPGLQPAQLVGKSLTQLLVGDDSQEKLQSVVGAANSIQQVVFQCQLKKQDETLVDVEWTGHWSASDAGFFCIVHDITEKKRLERLQRGFLAMVLHDLRSPISGMKGVLALMEAGILGRLTSEGQQITGKVRQNCRRLVRLLNDMLKLDRAGSGKFALQCCNFPLNAAIEQAIVDVRAQCRREAN